MWVFTRWKRLIYTVVGTTVCAFLSWIMVLGTIKAWPQIVVVVQEIVNTLKGG